MATHDPASLATDIQSAAFHRAQLESERTRIVGFLIALALLLAIVVARTLLFGEPQERELLAPVLLVVGLLLAYEALRLVLLRRHLAAGIEPPRWLWTVNLVIETAAPTVAILLLTATHVLGPYRTLTAPVLMAYPILVILSTLRLDPAHSMLTGLLSGAGYLGATAYTFARYPATPGAFGPAMYVTIGLLLILAGVVAGGVAREIRKHVVASLHEAETQRQLDRVRHDLDTARSIQQGLLPDRPPETPLYDIAGWNRPADETGGDYFDWETLDDGRLAISLADVSGHGLGPALLMAVCRAYARATSPAADLGQMLARLNQLLAGDVPSGRFATYVMARLEPAAGRLELASAGHGPLFLYRAASDDFVSPPAQGTPLGMFSAARYQPPTRHQMAPGDILLLVTDGFFEWANAAGEQYGDERIERVVRAGRDLSATDLISSLYRSVLDFASGTAQEDDLTAVVVKRRGSSGTSPDPR